MNKLKLKRLALSTAASILIGLSGVSPVYADDTDIYLSPPQVALSGFANAPNVLLILDTSASMNTVDVATKSAYNPGKTYSGETGAPNSSEVVPDKIYWSLDGNPPAKSSTQYFAAANNNCENSDTPLGSAGFYASGGAVLRHDDVSGPPKSKNGWKSFVAGIDQIVDCEADTPGNTQGYLNEATNSNDDAYIGTAADEIAFGNYQATQYKPTLFTSNYMSWHHNTTGLNVTLSRKAAAIAAIKSILNANPNVNFGLEVFNAESGDEERGGHIAMSVGPLTEMRWYNMNGTNTEQTRHQHLEDILDNHPFPGGGGTPLADTLWEAYRYLGGHDVTNRYGKPNSGGDWSIPRSDGCAEDPTANTNSTKCRASAFDGRYASPLALACQTAYIIYLSDGAASSKDTGTEITAAKLTAQPPSGVDKGQVLASISGNPLDELSEWMHNNDINHGTVADGHLAGKQNADLYFIGFGDEIVNGDSGDFTARNLLISAASKGGGSYYDAEDITSLTQAMQSALLSIQTGTSSFSAPALTVNAFNKLYNRDDIYFALFEPSTTVHWDGNIKKFKLCTAVQADNGSGPCEYGDVVDEFGNPIVGDDFRIIDTADSGWGGSNDGGDVLKGGVGAKLQALAPGSRTVYTYLDTTYSGLSSTSLGSLVEIETTGAAYDTFKQTGTGDPTLLGLPAAASDTDVQTLINWINGVDAYDKYNTDGDFTDNRWVMADPLHSPPIAVTYGKQSNDNDLPVIKLLTATNDGAIHMFNENTGNEQWSFIPGEMLPFQYELSQEDKGSHIYGVDNKIAIHIIDDDNDGIIEYGDGDRVYLFASMRRGRGNPTAAPFNNIYAFDITPTSALDTMNAESDITPKLMWVIEGGLGDYRRLAQTWSEPQVATIRVSCTGACTTPTRDVLLFGGGNYTGLESNATTPAADEGNAIFMASVEDGSRLWWASNTTAKDGDDGDQDLADLQLADMDYPIPSNLALLDTNGDSAIDRLYVGDMGGQIWRIDFAENMTPGTVSPNGGTKGYVFADVNCARASTSPYARDCTANSDYDYRRFLYAPDVAALRDTTYVNADYDIVTISSGNRADPVDKLTISSNIHPVENAIYAFRDFNYDYGPLASPPKPIVEADLHDATANLVVTGTGGSTGTKQQAVAELSDRKGWYIWLQESPNPIWTGTDAIGIAASGATRPWIGEKGLSKTVIFGGIVYATTYVPANEDTADFSSCSANEGVGYVYALDLFDATAKIDFSGTPDPDRRGELGGGIPTELVTVIREDGTIGLVGSSGGAVKVKVKDVSKAEKTFWYVE